MLNLFMQVRLIRKCKTMKTEFPLIGLSAGNRCTLSPDDVWKSKPRAIVAHDGLFEDGIPKNPVVIEVILP